ncbi:hypothetical protein SXCC_02281 [Gluconacetobacter sp. SXCC-1]|nr:hypothetical protein SXCC_02281 [Gluconacetobacter sp. SXCC-1]
MVVVMTVLAAPASGFRRALRVFSKIASAVLATLPARFSRPGGVPGKIARTVLAPLVARFGRLLAVIGKVARIVTPSAIRRCQGGYTGALVQVDAINHDRSPFPDHSGNTGSLFFLHARIPEGPDGKAIAGRARCADPNGVFIDRFHFYLK